MERKARELKQAELHTKTQTEVTLENPYADMLDMPHHVSAKHPAMSIRNRAAQFAPFAALTGYEEAVRETARLTSERIELDEDHKAILDEQLFQIQQRIMERPEVSITYYRPDEKKDGGAYLTVKGNMKKIDAYERMVILEDQSRIPIDDIIDIREGE